MHSASANTETLKIQRVILASPERVFSAWTDADEMQQWWGPKGVLCLSVEVDLRVGGHYRIANQLPDGSVLWIGGEFEVVERPTLLVYTWVVETESPQIERVTVRFQKRKDGTKIDLQHDLITSKEIRDQHHAGWLGCLEGLGTFVQN